MANDNQTNGDHDHSNKGWNDELNELTLSVMANRTKYDKCKKTLANTSDTAQEIFRKEKIYYKERILNMTRDLFHERCENDNINDAHQAYIKSCIDYLKWNDITDMVSEDKRNELRNDDIIQARNELQQKIQSSSLNDDEQEHDNYASIPPPSPPSPSSPPTHSQTQNIMSIANKMCIRKKTIDDFIVLRPRIDNTDHDINSRLPKVRDYQTEITKRVTAAAAAANAAERLT